MKKLLLLFLLLLSLVSCDSKKSDDSGSTTGGGNTVIAEKGTLDNPYSIAEALKVIGTEQTFSTKKIYITGIVDGEPTFNSKYSSYSLYLVDEAGGKSVQVYSATIDSSITGSTPTNGDTVVAGGYYCNYKGSKPELGGDTNTEYPVIYKITEGTLNPSGGQTDPNFESLEDDGRATESVILEFNEESRDAYASVEGKSYFWRKDNFIFENSAGERIKQVPDYLPYRFYVQTVVYFSVKTGTIKYLEFETESNYPFTGDEGITDGKIEVVSTTLTRIYAKKGKNKVRLWNENSIKNKKQIRVKSIKVVYFK